MMGKQQKKFQAASRKSRSGLTTLRKKLNIPNIYKRLASKLSIHGRHIRFLTSNWNIKDLQSLISQYQLSSTLKELYNAASLARPLVSFASQDLLCLCKSEFLCDLQIIHCQTDNTLQCAVKVHSLLFSKRTGIIIPWSASKVNNACEDKTRTKIPLSAATLKVPSTSTSIEFDKSSKTLYVKSNQSSPNHFLKDWLAHIYGKKCQIDDKDVDVTDLFNINDLTNNQRKTLQGDKNPNTMASDDLPKKQLSLQCKKEKLGTFQENFCTSMKDLWLSANATGDVKLISSANLPHHSMLQQPEIICHGFVLASRSTFFNSALIKYRQQLESTNYADLPRTVVTMGLDWKVFSPRYFRVVIYAMYTDEVNLQHIFKEIPPPIGPEETPTEFLSNDLKDLTELLNIGQFLGFTLLIQRCENLIKQKINCLNAVEMLHWSSQPHGSVWLYRQIIRFIQENFLQLSSSDTLMSLTCDEMCEIIQSDFVNSPELDILRCVLKWGEYELLRKIERREPNLVRSHVTLGNVARNLRSPSSLSARRRDVIFANHSEELHNCTAPLLRHVRLRHILPANHDVVSNAIKRGVISCPPEHLLEWNHPTAVASQRDNTFFWIREKAGFGFTQPRLFHPHFEEAKAILEERLSNDPTNQANPAARNSSQRLVSVSTSAPVPDTLYMVNKVRGASHSGSCDGCELPSGISVKPLSISTSKLKYIRHSYPVPPPSVASRLFARQRFLRQTDWINNVIDMCNSLSAPGLHTHCRHDKASSSNLDCEIPSGTLCHVCLVEHLVGLLVVREQGLPDIAAELLRRQHLYYDPVVASESSPLVALQKSSEHRAAVTSSANSPPKRLKKLFQKKTMPRKSFAVPDNLDLTRTWEQNYTALSSSSEQSLSDSSSVEWPFPYSAVDMESRDKPGSSFWGSDSSLSSAHKICVPDVAASACSTFPDVKPQTKALSSCNPSVRQSREVYDPATKISQLEAIPRRSLAPSYSHYLSLNRTRSSGQSPRTSCSLTASLNSRRPGLNNPIPQLVLDGTLPKNNFNKPDLFKTPADTQQTLQEPSSDLVTPAFENGCVQLSSSKETCL